MTTSKFLKSLEKQFAEYVNGKRKKFNLTEMGIHADLRELDGTPLQKSVWRELLNIPYGKVVSYSQLAERVGNAKAVRAVASAVGDNPLCVIIPCHRVLPKDSVAKLSASSAHTPTKTMVLIKKVRAGKDQRISVGEYALGADLKEALLRIEKVI